MRVMPRMLVYLRRIAQALERAHPPRPRAPRRVEFSVASAEDFERGYDSRNVTEDLDAIRIDPRLP